jgi:hypothetical protein
MPTTHWPSCAYKYVTGVCVQAISNLITDDRYRPHLDQLVLVVVNHSSTMHSIRIVSISLRLAAGCYCARAPMATAPLRWTLSIAFGLIFRVCALSKTVLHSAFHMQQSTTDPAQCANGLSMHNTVHAIE